MNWLEEYPVDLSNFLIDVLNRFSSFNYFICTIYNNTRI